jgi:hypothetical protein
MAEAEKSDFPDWFEAKEKKTWLQIMPTDAVGHKNPTAPSENEVQVHHDAYPTHPSITCPQI